jgi:hypothetical protein
MVMKLSFFAAPELY